MGKKLEEIINIIIKDMLECIVKIDKFVGDMSYEETG